VVEGSIWRDHTGCWEVAADVIPDGAAIGCAKDVAATESVHHGIGQLAITRVDLDFIDSAIAGRRSCSVQLAP
jgi:hypothetical protein